VINCASTYTAVLLRPGHRKNRALAPASLEGAVPAWWGPSLGRSGVGVRWGAPAPAGQREEQPPSDCGLVSVCENVDVATLRYPTATELRVYVIQSTDGLDLAGSSLASRAHGSAIYTADDDHSGCR